MSVVLQVLERVGTVCLPHGEKETAVLSDVGYNALKRTKKVYLWRSLLRLMFSSRNARDYVH